MPWITEKPNGTALLRWRQNGKEKSRIYNTRVEAEAALPGVEDQLASFKDPDDPRNPDWVPAWARDKEPEPGHSVEIYIRRVIHGDAELRAGSRRQYEATLRNHIRGTLLGTTAIEAVTPDIMRDFWAALKGGAGVRRNVYTLLSKGFTQAIAEGLIQVSPLKRARVKQPAKRRTAEVTPLEPEEIEALATMTRNDRERLAILLMGFAGLRAGEVGGLRVEDVDMESCKLHIRRQAIQDGGRKETDAPLKTDAARRTIAVACSVVRDLAVLVPSAADDGRLFHADNGGVWAAVRINEAVHRAADAAGIERNIHSHMLRHTAVSLLIRAGANPRQIQAFVGHSDIKETLGTYGHLFDQSGQALADIMEGLRHREGAQLYPVFLSTNFAPQWEGAVPG